jgi:hypothetical protein
LLALVVGLCMLSPHYQMTYYLLVAAGLWTVFLVFFDPERSAGRPRAALLGFALAAVLLGVAVAAIQVLPFLQYLPYSPRAAGGPSGGWVYATGFSMPPEEIVTTVLPQFNGVLEHYWGRNFFKLHTEYLGAMVVVLAALGVRGGERRHLVRALGGIALLFLLVAFGGHTPFYRLWYEVMPMMKKVRAPGMVFFLVALPVAVFAAFGAERLSRRQVSLRQLWVPLGVLGMLALLGAVGGLQGIAGLFAAPEQAPRLADNAGELQAGAARLLIVVLLGGAALAAVATERVRGLGAAGALAIVIVGDLWSVDRQFFNYQPPAATLYADDPIIARLRQTPKPFRVLDVGVYQGSYLMAHDVQAMLGYHGFELRYYDELMGGKNEWRNVGSPNLHDLLAVRYLLLPDSQTVPGFHQVLGPATTTPGRVGRLYERDSVPAYVRLVPAAAKLPDDQAVPTIIDPRFPLGAVVLIPDTASLTPDTLRTQPEPAAARATLTEWAPGRMRITVAGTDRRPLYLLVAENWYRDWHAAVDGKPAPVVRGDHTLITVPLPPGAREVRLTFASDAYREGRWITWLALLLIAGLMAWPAVQRRRTHA